MPTIEDIRHLSQHIAAAKLDNVGDATVQYRADVLLRLLNDGTLTPVDRESLADWAGATFSALITTLDVDYSRVATDLKDWLALQERALSSYPNLVLHAFAERDER